MRNQNNGWKDFCQEKEQNKRKAKTTSHGLSKNYRHLPVFWLQIRIEIDRGPLLCKPWH